MKTAPKFLYLSAILSHTFVLLSGAGCCSTPLPVAADEPKLLELSSDLGVHDPVIIKEEDTYYVFSTGGGRRGGIIPRPMFHQPAQLDTLRQSL